MLFHVHGEDRPDLEEALAGVVDEDELDEAHWSYMDRFELLLRGPTLSDDGEHTGSVHVVELADRAAAERFADEEPYRRAGLYERVTVARTEVLLDRRDVVADRYTLATAAWEPRARTEVGVGVVDESVRYLALLVSDDASRTVGLVAIVSGAADEAASVVEPLGERLSGERTTVTTRRWRPGGRPVSP